MDIMGMTITLGSLITLMGGLISMSNFFGGRTKKAKDDEARLVRIEAMLAQIDQNTSNLSAKVDAHDRMLTKHESRISVLEAEVKKDSD